jgi:alkanesulfonate monooxygenase SsuD/methylene tetrahydromethanopterin reductase-like flavin-dependent oxidoreductase (luciferase family)
MKFGIRNSSSADTPDPAEAFEAVKAKAQWAEEHGFVWFSVLDHMIQIPRVGGPHEPVLEGWTVFGALAAVPAASVSPPSARRSVIAIPRISPRSRRASI